MVFNCLQAQIHFFRGNSFCVLLMVKVDLLQKGFAFGLALVKSIECFHVTSRPPYWFPKTMKRRPCSKLVLCETKFSYANTFFCFKKFAEMLATWVKTLYILEDFPVPEFFFYVTQVEILCNEHIIHPFRTMKFIWISEWLNKVREIIKCLFYYCKQGNDFPVFIFATLRHMFKRG